MLLNCGVGKDSWESLGRKEIKPVNPKGNQPWIFIGRTDAEASVLWPPDVKSWHIGKNPDAGRDWGQEDKGATEGEMVGSHYQLDGYEFEQTPRDSEGQGSLACCSPWGCKESETTEWLNNIYPLQLYFRDFFLKSKFIRLFNHHQNLFVNVSVTLKSSCDLL